MPVYGPYHARHLHSRVDAEYLLRSVKSTISPLLATYRSSSPLISTNNGQYFDENTDGSALLIAVLEDILKQPLHLEKVIDGCLSNTNGQSQCIVVSLGPNSAEDMIVKALEANTSMKIFTHEHLHVNIPAGLTAFGDVPRTSKRPKLAIVGMAGRFPNAADHEKFWDLLEAGLDVHKKVMHNLPISLAQIYSSAMVDS